MKKEDLNGVVAPCPPAGGPRNKISKDPPSKEELEAAFASMKASPERALNKSATTPYPTNTATFHALNVIQETLDNDQETLEDNEDSRSVDATIHMQTYSPPENIKEEINVANNRTAGKLSVASAYKQHYTPDKSGHDAVFSPRFSVDSMQSAAAIARDLKRMQEGFRVKAFLSSHPEHARLHLDRQRRHICISSVSGNEEHRDGVDSNRCLKIPMNQVFKLEFGRNGLAGTCFNPQKSFSIAIENGPALLYFDFEAETPQERDCLVSTLIHVLEAIYNENEIRQDSLTVRNSDNERRDLNDNLENASYSSSNGPVEATAQKSLDVFLDDLDDSGEEEGGTIDQPIPCSPSLELTLNDFVQPSVGTENDTDAGGSVFANERNLAPFLGADSRTGLFVTEPHESRDQQDWSSRVEHESQSYDTFGKQHVEGSGFGDEDDEERYPELDPIEDSSKSRHGPFVVKSTGLGRKSPVVYPLEDLDELSVASPKSMLEFRAQAASLNFPPGNQLSEGYFDNPTIDLSARSSTADLMAPDLAPETTAAGDDRPCPPLLVPGQLVQDEPDKRTTLADNTGRGVIPRSDQPGKRDKNLLRRREQGNNGYMDYRSTSSFSENSTVIASNIRESSSKTTPRTVLGSPMGSSPSQPIFIDSAPNEPIFVDEGTDPEQKSIALDDNQSHSTNETYMGHVQGQGLVSTFGSKNFLDFSGRPPQSYDLRTSNSQHQLVSPWCSDDVCTRTFNDMAQSCSGMFATDPHNQHTQGQATCINPALLADDQIAVVQEYVKNALGAPSAMYEYFIEDPVPENPKDPQKHHGPLNNRVKNRAAMRNAQAGRYRDLRKEMTFVSALQNSREHMQILTTKSFNDAPPQRITNQAANKFLGSALLSSVVKTMVQQDVELPNAEDDDVVYYDSDPEDARERSLNDGPRRVSAHMRYLQGRESNVREGRSPPPGLGKIRNKLSRKVDESLVKEVVQVMQNDRLTLMWHPTQNPDKPNRAPTLVRLWIESGLQLVDGSFLLPKLTWTKVNDGNSRGFKSGVLHKLDLLDITRIRATDSIDRERHPFASRRVSFVIESQTDVYLFEAETSQERERVVYGLKVVVARLASLLMLRDYRAAEEFFGAPSNMVPGESPF